jgi:hypothetical protein
MSLGQITGIPVIEPASRKEQVEQTRTHTGLPNAPSSFAAFLTRAKSGAPQSDDGNNRELPPSREELGEFLRDQQNRMNLRLLDSLIGKEENSESVTGALDAIAAESMRRAPIGEASKYRQDAQKDDAPVAPPELAPIIRQAAQKYGVDSGLIRAVIKAESNFQSQSTSSKGAMGLMQLMPETAREVGVKDPYDPLENIMGGTRYLKGLLNRYQGNVPRALAAYNWGAGNVEKYPGRLPRETRDYIRRVTQEYQPAEA